MPTRHNTPEIISKIVTEINATEINGGGKKALNRFFKKARLPL